MRVRLFNFSNLFIVLNVLLVLAMGAGCDSDKDAADDSMANLDASDDSNTKPAIRVAMSKEAFVDFVANESVGRPGDGFVLFLKLPGKFSAEERTEKYADPIDRALQQADLGKVVSGAAMMGAKPFSSVSVDVSDLAVGLEVVIKTLQDVGAPAGTEIRYGEADDKRYLRFDSLK